MNFTRDLMMQALGITAYSAKASPWGFLIINDLGKWSASYRLLDEHIPAGESVSAASTMMGPFDDFAGAATAAEEKLTELRRLN